MMHTALITGRRKTSWDTTFVFGFPLLFSAYIVSVSLCFCLACLSWLCTVQNVTHCEVWEKDWLYAQCMYEKFWRREFSNLSRRDRCPYWLSQMTQLLWGFLAAHLCCEHPVPPDPRGALLGLDVGSEEKSVTLSETSLSCWKFPFEQEEAVKVLVPALLVPTPYHTVPFSALVRDRLEEAAVCVNWELCLLK